MANLQSLTNGSLIELYLFLTFSVLEMFLLAGIPAFFEIIGFYLGIYQVAHSEEGGGARCHWRVIITLLATQVSPLAKDERSAAATQVEMCSSMAFCYGDEI